MSLIIYFVNKIKNKVFNVNFYLNLGISQSINKSLTPITDTGILINKKESYT